MALLRVSVAGLAAAAYVLPGVYLARYHGDRLYFLLVEPSLLGANLSVLVVVSLLTASVLRDVM